MFVELRELLCSGAIRRHQLGAKDLLTPTSYDTSVKRSKSCSCLHDKAFELGTRQIWESSDLRSKSADFEYLEDCGSSVAIRVSNECQKTFWHSYHYILYDTPDKFKTFISKKMTFFGPKTKDFSKKWLPKAFSLRKSLFCLISFPLFPQKPPHTGTVPSCSVLPEKP